MGLKITYKGVECFVCFLFLESNAYKNPHDICSF